jgi:hypothetical protein
MCCLSRAIAAGSYSYKRIKKRAVVAYQQPAAAAAHCTLHSSSKQQVQAQVLQQAPAAPPLSLINERFFKIRL